jgi:hypothetical protein
MSHLQVLMRMAQEVDELKQVIIGMQVGAGAQQRMTAEVH